MKTVLVTGASGFIGRHTLSALLENYDEVHATYHSSFNSDFPDVVWHQLNLLDNDATKLIQRIKPSHMFHLAWYAKPGKYATALRNVDWFFSSFELIKAFHEAGGERVVIAGTCFEYDLNYGFLSEEFTPKTPNTLYGLCKRNLQETIQAYAEKTGLSYAWGRIFYTYGPHKHPDSLVSSIILALLRNEPGKSTNGHHKKDYLHVQDVADALVALLIHDIEGPVNIGSGRPISVRVLVQKIGKILNKENLIDLGALPGRKDEPPLVLADNRKLKYEVGWIEKYNIDEGLTNTVEWWKDKLDGQLVT